VFSGGEGCAIAISDANSDAAIWAQIRQQSELDSVIRMGIYAMAS